MLRLSVRWYFYITVEKQCQQNLLVFLRSIFYHIVHLCSHLTPAFSGAVNGTQRTRKNCAARPPLQRLVRRGLGEINCQLIFFVTWEVTSRMSPSLYSQLLSKADLISGFCKT